MLYKDLLPAKYKNQVFYVKKEAITGGIINQYSSTPNLTKNRKVVNLVNLPTEVSLEIFFTGALASYSARKFLKLGEELTGGNLQIPTFGLFKNMVLKEPVVINTDLKSVGMITCSVSFVENLDAEAKKNFLDILDEITQELNNLLDQWLDLFYFLSNLTEILYTVQANINRVSTAFGSPFLQAEDLANSPALKQFFSKKRDFYKTADTSIISESLNEKQDNLLISSNPIKMVQLNPINVLITHNKIMQVLGYLDNLKITDFANQDEIIKNISNIYKYQDIILYEDNLPIDIKNTLTLYINNFIDFLNSKIEELPSIYSINVKNESSLLLSYRLYNNIDKVADIEQLNNFEDLDDVTGKVKCLKYL